MSALRGLDRGHDLRRGVILVLVSGVSVLLLFTAMLLLQYGLFAAKGSASKVSGAQARLAALSGMDYASSRLAGGVYKRWSTTPLDRGDDWTERQGAGGSGQGSDNPSYSHGESWADDGDGIYEPGEPFADLDRDGRFFASSGRLRGIRFSLKVESKEAGIPVNGGILDDLPSSPGSDYRDLSLSCHRGIAHALNNLGALLLPDGSFRRADVPAGNDADSDGQKDGEKILVSWIGTDLILNRPMGGYRSTEQVRTVLRSVGYPDASIDPMLPYLDLGPYGTCRGTARETFSTINLSSAPWETLKALWMYAAVPYNRNLIPSPPLPEPPIPWGTPWTRSGPANLSYGSSGVVSIWPGEAGLLADLAHGLRQKGPCSWNGLRKEILDLGDAVFAADRTDWAASPGGQWAWTYLKRELAFHAVSPDPPPLPYMPMTFGTGGFDFIPAFPGIQPVNPFDFTRRGEIQLPAHPTLSYPAATPNLPYTGFTAIRPLELGMAPPVRFGVFCLGSHGNGKPGAAVEGTLQAAEAVELASQEDFENLSGAPRLSMAGIGVLDPFPKERRAWLSDQGRSYPHVKSYPRYNPPRWTTIPYSTLHGGLGLADRELGPAGASLYYPFGEDYSGGAAMRFPGEPGAVNPLAMAGTADSGASATVPWSVFGSSFFNYVDSFTGLYNPSAGGYVDFVSVEAWWSRTGIPFGTPCLLLSGPWGADPFAGDSSFGFAPRFSTGSSPGIQFRFGMNGWADHSNPTGSCYNVTKDTGWVRDWNPVDGSGVHNGHYHLVVTLEKQQAVVRTKVRVYLNGIKQQEFDYPQGTPAQLSYMYKTIECFTNRLRAYRTDWIDELRFYNLRLTDNDVLERFNAGRFARPLNLPAPSPARLLAERPDAPPNPTYRSPGYDLGPAARLGRASWTGWTADDPNVGGDLADKVRIRCVALGFDTDGNLVGSAELGDAGALADLASLGRIRSFRYAVEFYSPTGGDPGPLYDTPVFESVWFTVQRRGISPGWSAWQER